VSAKNRWTPSSEAGASCARWGRWTLTADPFEYIKVFYNPSHRHSKLRYGYPVRLPENWTITHTAQQPMAG